MPGTLHNEKCTAPEQPKPLWYSEFSAMEKMAGEEDKAASGGPGVGGATCPSCRMPFDKGKKRKLIDACGHERCYSCMFNNDRCPLCSMTNAVTTKISKTLNLVAHGRQKSDSGLVVNARPRLKTNGHFTHFMQSRRQASTSTSQSEREGDLAKSAGLPPHTGLSKDRPPVCHRDAKTQSPRLGRTSWSHGRHRPPVLPASSDRNSTFSVFQSWPAEVFRKIRSLWSLDEEAGQTGPCPPPAPESARNDLIVRLGLLFGDRGPAVRIPGTKNSFASMSSLTSSEATSNTSPLSTLTVSSGQDCRQDPSSESLASLTSTSTGTAGTGSLTSASPSGSMPRRYSVNDVGVGRDEDVLHARPPRERRSDDLILRPFSSENVDSHIHLKPLFFEVPCAEESPPFVGRQWLFEEMDEVLQSDRATSRGVVLTGGAGTGKTSVVLQLVDHSCFGRRKDEPLYYEIYDCKPQYLSRSRMSLTASRLSLSADRLRALSCRVVAFHFCQADDNATCSVPEFVHSLAAQMCQSPRLAAYRECLLAAPLRQQSLSMNECVADPSKALVTGVLEPLRALQDAGKITPDDTCLVLVDALDEAEFHRPDFGDTIASFLARHSPKFPSWLKLVLTVRNTVRDAVKRFPFHFISLDPSAQNENVQHDVFEYISYRIGHGVAIRGNVTFNSKAESCSTAKFTQHLLQLSQGCLLYAKLVLDLVERGNLVMKSASYKVLPISLAQVYLLHFNLRFPSSLSFCKVAPILSCCLASLYPLCVLEIYHTVNCGMIDSYITWDDFSHRMAALADVLVKRQDGTYMYFHPSFREWLAHRPPGESSDFVCDARQGHANISFRLSRLEYPLVADKVLELGHHILKARIYKIVGRGMSVLPRDAQALWVCLSTDDVSAALVAPRNLFCPNVKVSRLLLLAGADPNRNSGVLDGAPALTVAAHEGLVEMVVTLLEFGADVDAVSATGATALMHACANNRMDVARLLLMKGASVGCKDGDGLYPLSHAARNSHLQMVSFLSQYLRPDGIWGQGSVSVRTRTIQQALVAAAFNGHTVVCEFLLNLADVRVNAVDETFGETALTAASARGMRETCAFLVRRGAAVATTNSTQTPALSCAVRQGHRDVADHLLAHAKAAVDQADGAGMTALMHAAANGHHVLLQTLLAHGASVSTVDGQGQSALCWACLRGQLQAASVLLGHGSSVHHCDSTGRTPLDLAAVHGDPRLVQLLLGHGAIVEHVDHSGTRPLDRAISCKNSAAVLCFLKKGAKLGPVTWAVASDKPDIMLILLNKLMDDGIALYKKSRLRDAAYRFQYALKKFPSYAGGEQVRPFNQLKLHLLLNLSRCHRKMNEPEAAVELSSKALEVNPRCYEAYYARARAKRDLKQLKPALEDMADAVKLAPDNKELLRIVEKLQEEIRENMPNHAVQDDNN